MCVCKCTYLFICGSLRMALRGCSSTSGSGVGVGMGISSLQSRKVINSFINEEISHIVVMLYSTLKQGFDI